MYLVDGATAAVRNTHTDLDQAASMLGWWFTV